MSVTWGISHSPIEARDPVENHPLATELLAHALTAALRSAPVHLYFGPDERRGGETTKFGGNEDSSDQ